MHRATLESVGGMDKLVRAGFLRNTTGKLLLARATHRRSPRPPDCPGLATRQTRVFDSAKAIRWVRFVYWVSFVVSFICQLPVVRDGPSAVSKRRSQQLSVGLDPLAAGGKSGRYVGVRRLYVRTPAYA